MSPKNVGAKSTTYFTPSSDPPPGTALDPSDPSLPTLFKPLSIRGATFKNRIWAAPMCQYSASPVDDASTDNVAGALTPYHLVHLGHLALKGCGLTFIEATSVTANGRISPNDAGLWHDGQIPGMRRVADFVHAQGALIGIQLAHAGRKASTVAPWLGRERGKSVIADTDVHGWPDDVVAPSRLQWSEGYNMPRELPTSEVEGMVTAFADSAKRALEAGVDVIEIHGAHGYLLNEFLSPITNHRTDKYGGSFENRVRFTVEVCKAVRAVIPDDMPLMLRLSATEWMDESAEAKERGSWDVNETIKLSKLLPDLGVDLLDVSSGGNHEHQRIQPHSNYQIDIAGQIRSAMKKEHIPLLIGAVGMITEAEQARSILQHSNATQKSVSGSDDPKLQQQNELQEGSTEDEAQMVKDSLAGGDDAKADAVFLARQFMREPEWVLRAAHALDVKVAWPVQFSRARFLAGQKSKM